MDILLVDDEKGLLEQAKIFLERQKEEFNIDTALSAKDALDKFENQDYDAIVSDYQMPVIDGLDFLKKIREQKNEDTPFIIFTGKGREEVAIEALNLGADRYLQKGGSPKSQYDVLAQAVLQEVKHHKTQKALDLSQQRYESITEDVMDNSDVAMFILDSDFNIAWINRAVEDYFGVDKENMIGKDKEKLVKEKIKHRFEKPDRFEEKVISTYKNNDYIEDFDCHVLSDNKNEIEERWLRHWSKPIETGLYEGGRMEHYTDITEKRKRQERLKENKNWLSQIVKGSSVPTFVIDKDHDVTHWNKACENLTGIKKDEIVGTKESWKAFYDEERPVMADLVLKNADEEEIEEYYEDKFTRSTILNESYEAEDLFTSFGEEGKWVYFTAAPIKDSQGNRVGAIETLQDITERKQVEEKFKKSHRRFNAIYDDPSTFIGILDKEGNLISANRSSLEFIGARESELKGQKFWKTPWWDHSKRLQEKLRDAISEAKEGSYINFEAKHYGKNDDKIFVDFYIRPVEDEEGEIVSLIVEGNNITERKKAENKRDEYQKILSNTLDAIDSLILVIDEDHRIVLCNWKDHEWIPEEEREKRQYCYKAMKDYDESCEYCPPEETFKDGKPRFYEDQNPIDDSYKEISVIPIFNEDGDVEYVLENVRDVTERKKREKENERIRKRLQEAVTRFRKISEISPYAVILVDKENGLIKDANKAAEDLIHENRKEIIGKRYLDLHPDEEKEKLENIIFYDDNLSFSKEFNIIDSNDEEIPVEISTSSFELGDNEIIYVALNDITARKRMRDREEFLHSILRHDLKNKIQISRGYLELLNDLDLPDDHNRYLNKSIDNFEEGMDIIKKVRKLRKVKDVEIKEVELDSIIDEIVDKYRPEAENNDMELVKNIDSSEIKVKGGELLSEVFSNIVQNSIKHSNGNRIAVSLKETENDVICVIKDDGEGLNLNNYDKIFNKGFTTVKSSSGLGLFLAKEITQKYDGDVQVEDSDMGGLRFDIILKKYRCDEGEI